MTRRMSTSRRARIFEASGGICHICGQAIDGTRERWDVEHIVPYALTRDDSEKNLAPAHVSCHAGKTKKDVAQIAKAKRIAAKHQGAWKPQSTIPGSKGSAWKRKLDGTTIRRTEE